MPVGRGPAGLSAPQVKRRSTCCAIPIEAIGETGRGWIAVQAKRAGDFAEIAVRDSGPGFPPDLAANPFLPFASTTTKAEGLGIGLALSRSIIEAHGGHLWLDTDGPGGAVRFTVPIVKGAGRG